MSRPFAAFDIDGTLIRWQLYHAIADKLAQNGLLDPQAFAKVKHARMTWKKRTSANSFDDYEATLVRLFNQAIVDIRVEDFQAACQSVLEEYKDQVYTYTRDLITELRKQNYLLFAISGSQQEIVRLLADYYQFDDYGGTVYEIVDGRFTGHSDPLRSDRKPALLKQLAANHNATWQGSVAVGDSEGDIPMLEIVERPIAFNPSQALFRHAAEKGWKVVLERKNMVYRLEPRNGSYLLA